MILERLIVLGAGTIIPSPGHGCPACLLEGSSGPVLVDCGPGTLPKLAEAGVRLPGLGLIFVTHFHLDHVSDLAAILLSRWMQVQGGGHELEIVGPVGTKAHLAWLGERMDPWFKDYSFTVHEAAEGELSVRGLRVRTARTGHTAESLCFRVTDERGASIFFGGDMGYNDALVAVASAADIAVLECSTPDSRRIKGHLTPSLAAGFAARAKVGRLVLTHFYPWFDGVDILGEAGARFDGPIALAEDGSSYPLRPLVAIPSTM